MKDTLRIIVIHGPNLNLLGSREVNLYGSYTLSEINRIIERFGDEHSLDIDFFQSNNEGDIVDFIQKNRDSDGIVINPAGYTHTSIAIRDAISAIDVPTVEVHLSNIHSREEFRKTSFIAPVCIGQISGFGYFSYILGLYSLIDYLSKK